ncbi:hypothetical protein NA655_08625 [Pseudomonas kuykendallii]|uniref:Uncharacterized protein n=1 Tax=Pseudomonas kuykendallii TaxID=1007099 RepID=A0A1H3EIK3_9PSED|nr:hypothetical protein [Pseudomonas kuykendallii]MCQ4271084.1 hypothetical protein [Pseudomonas kuykendallii]SDX78531.1 hypothetical protein SAMN05216287_3738 [Pseudomonas kuykendallii]
MRFINNWITQLDAELPVGGTTLPIPAAALDRLDLSESGYYLLTLVPSMDPLEQQNAEVVRIFMGQDGPEIERGVEQTTERAWSAGAYVIAGVTAGMMRRLTKAGQFEVYSPGEYAFGLDTGFLYVQSEWEPGDYAIETQVLASPETTAFDFHFKGGGGSTRIILSGAGQFASAQVYGMPAGRATSVEIDGSSTIITGLTGGVFGRCVITGYNAVYYVTSEFH